MRAPADPSKHPPSRWFHRNPRWLRRSAVGALVLVMTFFLAACSPEIDGVAGMTTDASGEPIALIKSCTEPMDIAALYRPSERMTPAADRVRLANWEFSSDLDSDDRTISWPLLASPPPPGVTLTEPLQQVSSTERVMLGGWTSNQDYSVDPVYFTLDRLRNLKPGQVLIGAAKGQPDVVTLDEFERSTCPP